MNSDLHPTGAACIDQRPAQQPATDQPDAMAMGLLKDFCLGEWLVKPQLNQLQMRTGDLTRHLEPRLTTLLCCLAAHGMEVVDRDTLVGVLWPRVIVNENSLTRAVSELRKQLALAQRGLVYIETIPKRGYRLRLPVEPAPTCETGMPATEDTKPANNGFPLLPLYARAKRSTVAAFVLTLLLGIWLQFHGPVGSSTQSGALADELIRPEAHADISSAVVMSAYPGSRPTPERVTQPLLSRDQSQFAYLRYDHTGSTLFLGKVASNYAPVAVFNSMNILYNLTWSPVGNALLFAGKPGGATSAVLDPKTDPGSALYRLDLDSLSVSQLVEKPTIRQAPADSNELRLT